MKSNKIVLLAVMVAALLMASAMPANAGPLAGKKTPFTLIEAVWLGDNGNPGIWVSPGNSGNNQWRETTFVWDLKTTDPRASGLWVIQGNNWVLKSNHPMPDWGPGHGTWTLDTNRDGAPEWQGQVHIMPDPRNFTTVYNGQGLGIYEGMTIKMGDHDGLFDGEIFDPHAK